MALPEGLTDVGGAPVTAPADFSDAPQPTIPTDLTITLPAGYLDERGQLHTQVQVKELTGAAEEALSRIDPVSNLGAYISTVLRHGVVTVGKETATDEILRKLVQGDRTTLLLAIRRATYGDTMTKTLVCECGIESEVEIDLANDIPMKALEDPTTRTRDVELRNGHIAHVRIPDGFAEEDLLSPANAKKTSKELNTLLLLNVVEDIDGNPVHSKDMILHLGAADRKAITAFLATVQPGPQYGEVEVPCSSCQRTYPLEVDLADLLQG